MQAEILWGAILFQQHTISVTDLPFIRGTSSIAAFSKRSCYSFHEWRLDVRLNGIVLPIDDED